LNNNSFERKFYASSFYTNAMIVMGILLLIFELFISRYVSAISLLAPIVLITVGILSKRRPLLTLFEDHAESRLAPLRGLTLFRYSDIDRIDIQRKKIFIALKNNVRPVKINLSSFSAEERADLTRILESKKSSAGFESE